MKPRGEKKEGAYFIYLLRCRDKSIYTGITTDVARRLAEHKAGKASRYTRAHGAVKVLYTERVPSRSAALKREAAIKRMTRSEKLVLVSSHLHPHHRK